MLHALAVHAEGGGRDAPGGEDRAEGRDFRINLALYSSYASDFDSGEREARTAIELGTPWGWQALAMAQTGKGLVPTRPRCTRS